MMYGRNKLIGWAADGGVKPYEPRMIDGKRPNECAIDIRLGATALDRESLPGNPFTSEAACALSLAPGEFCLGLTLERFAIPDDAVGLLGLRSEWAQRGLNQATSILLKPGWSGFLILELQNISAKPIRLRFGDAIASISLMECSL